MAGKPGVWELPNGSAAALQVAIVGAWRVVHFRLSQTVWGSPIVDSYHRSPTPGAKRLVPRAFLETETVTGTGKAMKVGLIVPGFSADADDWCIPALRNFV